VIDQSRGPVSKSPFVSYMCCGKSTPTQIDAAALARKPSCHEERPRSPSRPWLPGRTSIQIELAVP